MMNVTARVALRSILAKVILRHDFGKTEVFGSPAEMKDLRQQLSTLGFVYDPGRRLWKSDNLPPRALRDLQRLIAWYENSKRNEKPKSGWEDLVLEMGGI